MDFTSAQVSKRIGDGETKKEEKESVAIFLAIRDRRPDKSDRARTANPLSSLSLSARIDGGSNPGVKQRRRDKKLKEETYSSFFFERLVRRAPSYYVATNYFRRRARLISSTMKNSEIPSLGRRTAAPRCETRLLRY